MEIATGLIVAGVGYLIGTRKTTQVGGNSNVDWKTTHARAREYSELTEWPVLPQTIKRVEFINCEFSAIPDLSSTRLSDISFYDCIVPVDFPRLPETLIHLKIVNCGNDNNIPMKISNLPNSLYTLNLSATLIEILPELPEQLRKLIVSHTTNVVELTSLPEFLKTLEIHGSGIISNLSTLEFPEKLERLVITNCELNEISYIPDSVKSLTLKNNRFNSMCFPGSIRYLNIDNNEFTSLERLPPKLVVLSAVNNQITKINEFPQSIGQVYLVNNKLTKLPQPMWRMRINVTGNQFPLGYINEYKQKYINRTIRITADPEPERQLSTREPLGSTEWYNMCNSETNIISQNPWETEDDNTNVVIITKDGRDNCYDAKDLLELVKNTDLHVRKWKERPGQTNSVAEMSVGFGFEPDPNSDVYVKLLPEYGSSYIRLLDVENMLYNSTKRYFVTSSLGNHRVGNLRGSRGVSEVHGQGPPFPELLTLAESSVVPSMKVRDTSVVRPTETTAESRAAMAERIAASRARQATINMDEEEPEPEEEPVRPNSVEDDEDDDEGSFSDEYEEYWDPVAGMYRYTRRV